MDAIHEYLLLKGVQAAAIHGGKDQEDRIKAVAEFRCANIFQLQIDLEYAFR